MVSRNPAARLVDIIEAIEIIEADLAGVSLSAFAADRRKRWLVEHGLEIVSEASRRLPEEMKARHGHIPWPKVAGIGNILRHEYEHIAHDVLWRVARDDLSDLDRVCRAELAALGQDSGG